jgi:hypothetical protein
VADGEAEFLQILEDAGDKQKPIVQVSYHTDLKTSGCRCDDTPESRARGWMTHGQACECVSHYLIRKPIKGSVMWKDWQLKEARLEV